MDIYNYLEKNIGKGKITQNELLRNYTTFKIGGFAEYFYKACSVEELIKIIKIAKNINLKYQIIGGGSNILISDKGLSGLTIRNESNKIKIIKQIGKIINGKTKVDQILIEADSGVLVNQLVRFCCDNGFKGVERHLGLPGTVGGAIFTNSKWTNPLTYIGDNLYSGKILDKNGEIKTVKQNYFNFDYDQSILQKTHEILLSATFLLKKYNKDELWEIAQNSIFYRKKSQPMGQASAGCVFKNIKLSDAIRISTPNHTLSVGYLLDQLGLKNYSIGDAKFSEKHANFIINSGNAKAKDVKKLIDLAISKIKLKFGIDLELEIYLMGEFN